MTTASIVSWRGWAKDTSTPLDVFFFPCSACLSSAVRFMPNCTFASVCLSLRSPIDSSGSSRNCAVADLYSNFHRRFIVFDALASTASYIAAGESPKALTVKHPSPKESKKKRREGLNNISIKKGVFYFYSQSTFFSLSILYQGYCFWISNYISQEKKER